jgi:hypothetical protein
VSQLDRIKAEIHLTTVETAIQRQRFEACKKMFDAASFELNGESAQAQRELMHLYLDLQLDAVSSYLALKRKLIELGGS